MQFSLICFVHVYSYMGLLLAAVGYRLLKHLLSITHLAVITKINASLNSSSFAWLVNFFLNKSMQLQCCVYRKLIISCLHGRIPGIILLGFVVARRWAYPQCVLYFIKYNIYYDHFNYITSYILIKTPTYDFQ